jgi:rRNA-processing protein FCF1
MATDRSRGSDIKMDVICDTSFLMVLVSTPIKQIDKVEANLGKLNFLVPDIVIDELKRLEEWTGPKRSMIAKTAIEISNSKFKVVKVIKTGYVDDAIIQYSVSRKCAAATIDTDLRRRLISNNVIVITLSKNRLMVANPRLVEQL